MTDFMVFQPNQRRGDRIKEKKRFLMSFMYEESVSLIGSLISGGLHFVGTMDARVCMRTELRVNFNAPIRGRKRGLVLCHAAVL